VNHVDFDRVKRDEIAFHVEIARSVAEDLLDLPLKEKISTGLDKVRKTLENRRHPA